MTPIKSRAWIPGAKSPLPSTPVPWASEVSFRRGPQGGSGGEAEGLGAASSQVRSWNGPSRRPGGRPSTETQPRGARDRLRRTQSGQAREGRGGAGPGRRGRPHPAWRSRISPLFSHLFAQRPHLILVKLFTLVQLLDPLVQLLGERLVVHGGPIPWPAASLPPPRPFPPPPRAPLPSPAAAAAASSQRERRERGSAAAGPSPRPRPAGSSRRAASRRPSPARLRAPGVGKGRGEVGGTAARDFDAAPAGR